MKIRKVSSAARFFGLRRDIRHVERALRKFARPRDDDVLDMAGVRRELRQLIRRIPPEHIDAAFYDVVDEFIDSHVADFLQRLRNRHNDQLTRLDRLEIRVRPYLLQVEELMNDQAATLSYYDVAIKNVLDRVADPETPLTDPRASEEPRRRPI